MTDFEIIATVIAAFFIIGVGVGIVTVIAMSAMRLHGRGEIMRRGWPGEGEWPGRPGEPDPGSGDDPPRWPDG